MFNGKVIGTDETTDLAVIKLDPTETLPFAALGNSDDLKIGQVQYALVLYMYAIEEYGKAHRVKSCFTGPENVASVPGWRPGPDSGKTSHVEKLGRV